MVTAKQRDIVKEEIISKIRSELDKLTSFNDLSSVLENKDNEFMFLAYICELGRWGTWDHTKSFEKIREKARKTKFTVEWESLRYAGFRGQCWDSDHPYNLDPKYLQYVDDGKKMKYLTTLCRLIFRVEGGHDYMNTSISKALEAIGGFHTSCAGTCSYAYWQGDIFMADFKLFRDTYDEYLEEYDKVNEELKIINFEELLKGEDLTRNHLTYTPPLVNV